MNKLRIAYLDTASWQPLHIVVSTRKYRNKYQTICSETILFKVRSTIVGDEVIPQSETILGGKRLVTLRCRWSETIFITGWTRATIGRCICIVRCSSFRTGELLTPAEKIKVSAFVKFALKLLSTRLTFVSPMLRQTQSSRHHRS